MTRFRNVFVLASVCVIGAGLAACGGSDGGSAGGGGPATVVIEGDDRMQFDVRSFTVQSGQTVQLTLKHVGQMSAEQMGHNVVILNADEDPQAFGDQVQRQGGSMDNDYLPEEMRDRVVAYTRMIGGGDEDSIEFVAPEPGEYPYICSFPGHYGMMRGVMIVR